MADTKRKIEIGFSGGQVLALRMEDKPLAKLRDALESSGEGWTELSTEDGELTIDLAEVVFVRSAGGRAGIGFMGG